MPRKVPQVGRPAPDPPGARDLRIVEGPDAVRIAQLLDETTQIAEKDWVYRCSINRRNAIWKELAELGVTLGRMQRAYAINGVPIITHVTISNSLRAQGLKREPIMQRKPKEATE